MSIVVNTGQTYTDTFVKGLAEGVYINETLEDVSTQPITTLLILCFMI